MIKNIKNFFYKIMSIILTDRKFYIGRSCTIQDLDEDTDDIKHEDIEFKDIYGNKVFKFTKKYRIKQPHDSYELVGIRLDENGVIKYELSSTLTRDTLILDKELFEKYFEDLE